MERSIHAEGYFRESISCHSKKKIDLQPQRLVGFQKMPMGHDKVSTMTQRQVVEWLADLYQDGNGLAASTENNHQAIYDERREQNFSKCFRDD